MTSVSYYPGCSLHGTAREYDLSVRALCGALGVTLEELPDWNCCGASSAHRVDSGLAVELAARNLRLAEQAGRDLLSPCAACYSRLKHAQHELGDSSRLSVLNMLDFLARPELLERLKRRIVRPLGNMPVAPYYGCLLTRPGEVTGAANVFNPMGMDDLLLLAGAQVRRWSGKTTCCGASFTLAETDIVRRLCGQLRDQAAEAGAEAFVSACPMCTANLDTRQDGEPKLPVLYISELLALAAGADEVEKCWPGHRIDPRPVLQKYGVLA